MHQTNELLQPRTRDFRPGIYNSALHGQFPQAQTEFNGADGSSFTRTNENRRSAGSTLVNESGSSEVLNRDLTRRSLPSSTREGDGTRMKAEPMLYSATRAGTSGEQGRLPPSDIEQGGSSVYQRGMFQQQTPGGLLNTSRESDGSHKKMGGEPSGNRKL